MCKTKCLREVCFVSVFRSSGGALLLCFLCPKKLQNFATSLPFCVTAAETAKNCSDTQNDRARNGTTRHGTARTVGISSLVLLRLLFVILVCGVIYRFPILDGFQKFSLFLWSFRQSKVELCLGFLGC